MNNYDENRKAYIKSLSKDKQFAIALHDRLCHDDHTGAVCGWYYEIHNGFDDWDGFEHIIWLKRAREVMAITEDTYQIMAILDALKII